MTTRAGYPGGVDPKPTERNTASNSTRQYAYLIFSCFSVPLVGAVDALEAFSGPGGHLMPDTDAVEPHVPAVPPADLAMAGLGLWNGVAGSYKLRVDELSVLEQAAFEADLIADLRVALVGSRDRLVRGSQGQLVIHPIISELRQHRATLAALLRQLKLPDLDGDAPTTAEAEAGARSSQARAAANARWSRRGSA